MSKMVGRDVKCKLSGLGGILALCIFCWPVWDEPYWWVLGWAPDCLAQEITRENVAERAMELIDTCHGCCQEIRKHEHGQEIENLLAWVDNFIKEVCVDVARYKNSQSEETLLNLKIAVGNLISAMDKLKEAIEGLKI